jgi:hypothetical protein
MQAFKDAIGNWETKWALKIEKKKKKKKKKKIK